MGSWKNVEGTVYVSVSVKDGKVVAYSNKTSRIPVKNENEHTIRYEYVNEEVEHSGEHFQALLSLFSHYDPKPEELEMAIHFLSSGYYTPAYTSGPPENCYPEEFDDERLLDFVEIDGIKVPQELGDKIFDEFFHLVEEKQIDTEPDYDDREPDYD